MPPPRPLGRRLLSALIRAACWAVLAGGVAMAFYLTLRPSSDLRTVDWIPQTWARWADYHGRSRNIVAYALLALPVLVLFRERRPRLIWVGVLALLATLLECAQEFIPSRYFEWQDIALSWVGLGCAWILAAGFSRLARAWRHFRRRLRHRGRPASPQRPVAPVRGTRSKR